MVVAKQETAAIEAKLSRIKFMAEPGRKLFGFDAFCRDPINWDIIKRRKRSFTRGAKVRVVASDIGNEEGDTLVVLKELYGVFRTERDDHLSEDMLLAVVPGARQDNPVNDALQAAWKSLKALGTKFQGPKIGQIHVNQNEVLAATYTRGAWNQAPMHHVVFTYQAVQQAFSGRKKMKYLKTKSLLLN